MLTNSNLASPYILDKNVKQISPYIMEQMQYQIYVMINQSILKTYKDWEKNTNQAINNLITHLI